MASIDLTGYHLTFDDEFNARSISQKAGSTTWGDIRSEWRADANSDIGFGHSSFMDPSSGYDPFNVSGGALKITAVPDQTKYGSPGSWESGLLTTQGSFSQKYGYFEIRANFSNQPGAWDAFWLLPDKQIPDPYKAGNWQELDVVEHYGGDPKSVYSTIHTTDPQNGVAWQDNRQVYSQMAAPSGYHTYGVNWQADYISFYVDGKFVGKQATPSDMHSSMYLLLDLATQGADHASNNADAAGVPLSSYVDYVRVYSNDPTTKAVALQTVSSPDGHDPGLYGATAAATTAIYAATVQTAKSTLNNQVNISNQSSFGAVTTDPHSEGGQVYALYHGLLKRAPDIAGLEHWITALDSGTSLHDVTASILASSEGRLNLNASDNPTFVQQLYETVLGRPGDASGLASWTASLNNGTSRADVSNYFVFSPEHLADLQSAFQAGMFVPNPHAADVARLYYALLDRAPDAAGLQSFTSAVENSGASLHDIAQGMLSSPEYHTLTGTISDSAFVESLYENALGRQVDASGEQSWLNLLLHGTSRAGVAVAIAESTEAHQYLVSSIEQGWHLA